MTQISFSESSFDLGVEHFSKGNMIGAGISIFDFNRDGYNDLTLATDEGHLLAFYQNGPDGFTKIDAIVDCTCHAKQILWVDYDNDDDYDLYISCFSDYNRLYENQGDLQLVDATEWVKLPTEPHNGYGATFGDYDRDGWLDLYYVSRDLHNIFSEKNENFLYRNNGDRTFSNVSRATHTDDLGKIPFCSIFFDYNNDHWPDLYTAQDKLQLNSLLKNNHDGTFSDVGAITRSDERMNGMCTAAGDVNMDGFMDMYITNTPVGNRLLMNQGENPVTGESEFIELAEAYGVSYYGWGWASQFFDADNDQDLDLYVSGGLYGENRITSALYEQNQFGRYDWLSLEEMTVDSFNSHSNAIGDLNNDGLLDIVVHNNNPYPFQIWMNQSNKSQNWIKIDLEGILSNKDAIGCRIELFTDNDYLHYQTYAAYGFLGQNPHENNIGIGQAEIIDSLIITWPTGHIDRLYHITPNQKINITEGQSSNGIVQVANAVTELHPRLSTAVKDAVDSKLTWFNYPNPTMGQSFLESNEEIKLIEVINVHGEIVSTIYPTNKEIEIDNSHLKSGLYFIKIYSKDKIKAGNFIKL